MESLVRVRSGAFALTEAVSLDDLADNPAPAGLLKEAASGLGFPAAQFDDESLMEFINGKEIPCPEGINQGLVSITRKGRLIALAAVREKDGERLLGPRRVLEPNLKELLKQTDK
jgi:tRNA U55 pseudouridine synthase TruB